MSPSPAVDAIAQTDIQPRGEGTGHRIERWLVWFALAVIIGMQAGTVFKPFGSLGETRVADWIDLLTPFAVVGCAAMVMRYAAPNPMSWVCFVVGGVAFVLGHGLHLSANSISNVDDKTVAHADIVHLWDEVVSHRFWYAGLYLILVALAVALRDQPIGIRPVGRVLAVLFAITLVNTYIEGGMPWLGLAFLTTGIVAGSRWRDAPVARLALLVGSVGVALLVIWGVYWYATDGIVFPEFSDVGWI